MAKRVRMRPQPAITRDYWLVSPEDKRLRALHRMRSRLKADIADSDPIFRTLLLRDKRQDRDDDEGELRDAPFSPLIQYCLTGECDLLVKEHWWRLRGRAKKRTK